MLEDLMNQTSRGALDLIHLRGRLEIGYQTLAAMRVELARVLAGMPDGAEAREGSEKARTALEEIEVDNARLEKEVKETAVGLEELRLLLTEMATFALALASTRAARRLVWATWALVLFTVTLAAPTLKSAGAFVVDLWP